MLAKYEQSVRATYINGVQMLLTNETYVPEETVQLPGLVGNECAVGTPSAANAGFQVIENDQTFHDEHLCTTNEVAAQLGLVANKAVVTAINNGTVLSARLARARPSATLSSYRCSNTYIQAIRWYQSREKITSIWDALQEVAYDEFGRYLAYGIRCEREARLRAYGVQIPLADTVRLTGFSGEILNTSGLVELQPDAGRKSLRFVATAAILKTMQWQHAAFRDNEKPPPIEFCDGYEAKGILNCSASHILRLAQEQLVPAWRFKGPDAKYHYPRGYIERLAVFRHSYGFEMREAAALLQATDPFRRTIIRGQFEACARYKASENASDGTSEDHLTGDDMATLLGVSPRSIYYHYEPTGSRRWKSRSPDEVIDGITWNWSIAN
jgi:hypothetical protein